MHDDADALFFRDLGCLRLDHGLDLLLLALDENHALLLSGLDFLLHVFIGESALGVLIQAVSDFFIFIADFFLDRLDLRRGSFQFLVVDDCHFMFTAAAGKGECCANESYTGQFFPHSHSIPPTW